MRRRRAALGAATVRRQARLWERAGRRRSSSASALVLSAPHSCPAPVHTPTLTCTSSFCALPPSLPPSLLSRRGAGRVCGALYARASAARAHHHVVQGHGRHVPLHLGAAGGTGGTAVAACGWWVWLWVHHVHLRGLPWPTSASAGSLSRPRAAPPHPHLPAGAAVRHVLQAAGLPAEEDCRVRQGARVHRPHGALRCGHAAVTLRWAGLWRGARLPPTCPTTRLPLRLLTPPSPHPTLHTRSSMRTASRSTACCWCTCPTAPPPSSACPTSYCLLTSR